MRRILGALCAAVCLLGMGGSALALVAPRPPMAPAPEGWAYRWIAPTYRTVQARVWVPEVCTQEMQWIDIGGGRYVQAWVPVVQPGYWTITTRQELIDTGHWELVAIMPPPRPIPMPRPVPMPMPMPRPVVVVPSGGTVGVDGYGGGGGAAEDAGKFSGLSEWPK